MSNERIIWFRIEFAHEVSPEFLERCRENIHTLFLGEFFNIRQGTTEIYLNDGLVQTIKLPAPVWKRNKDIYLLQKKKSNVTIVIDSPTFQKSGQPLI
ncbi:MAG: hypothetical protein AABY15_00925 [Nanoarchaeota archaeon]